MLLDRLSPKPVLTAAAGAAALVALVLTGVTGVAGTLGLAAGFGLCAALLQPGLGAIVPRLAPADAITPANSYLQAATWGGMTAGPLLAGGLGAAGGPRLALVGDAATYAAGTAGLALLQLSRPSAPDGPPVRETVSRYSGIQLAAASAGMAAASGLLAPLGARVLLVLAGCGGIVAGAVGWVIHACRSRHEAHEVTVDERGAEGDRNG